MGQKKRTKKTDCDDLRCVELRCGKDVFWYITNRRFGRQRAKACEAEGWTLANFCASRATDEIGFRQIPFVITGFVATTAVGKHRLAVPISSDRSVVWDCGCLFLVAS